MSGQVVRLKPGDKLPPGVFGFVGSDRWETLSNGRMGVIRNITEDSDGNSLSNVYFESAPNKSGRKFAWSQGVGYGNYEFDLGTERDPQSLSGYQSLTTLASELQNVQRSRGRLAAEDERLKLLDEVIDSLLSQIDSLHKQGRTIGLLTPDNIIFYLEQGQLRLILPDVGFSWRGAPPGPRWIEKLDKSWGELWHPQAADVFQGRVFDDAAKRADLVLVARIICWMISGERNNIDQELRSRFLATATESRPSTPHAACWQSLFRTLGADKDLRALALSPIRSIEELRSQLALARTSEHYCYRKSKTTKPLPVGRIAVGILSLGLVAGLGYGLMNWIPHPIPPSILCPECRHPSPLIAPLIELEPTVEKLEADFAILSATPSSLNDASMTALLDSLRVSAEAIKNLDSLVKTNGAKPVEIACVAKLEAAHSGRLEKVGFAFIQRAGNRDAFAFPDKMGRAIADMFDTWCLQVSSSSSKEKPQWYVQIRQVFGSR